MSSPRNPDQVQSRSEGVQHLPLGALTRIEEEALGVPPQEVAVLAALPRRHLTPGAQDNQFAHAPTVASAQQEKLGSGERGDQ